MKINVLYDLFEDLDEREECLKLSKKIGSNVQESHKIPSLAKNCKLYAMFHFLLDFQAQLHFLLQTVLLSCSVIACLCNLSYNSNPHR